MATKCIYECTRCGIAYVKEVNRVVRTKVASVWKLSQNIHDEGCLHLDLTKPLLKTGWLMAVCAH